MEKIAWQGNIIKVTTELIDGNVWERAYLHDGVVIFPVTDEGKILLIRERRPHEKPTVRLKPVSGMLDSDQSPIETANRELQEEIGLKAAKLEHYWTYHASGSVNSNAHFFLARGLSVSKLPNPDGDVVEEIIAYTPEEIDAKVRNEEMRWGVSVMGWLRLRQLNLSGQFKI